MKCEITYLNLVDEALGSALHSLRLLDLGDLLMAGLVVLTMVPYIDVLATIVGAPLDLFHFIVGGRLSFLALCATPNHDRGHHRTITMVRSTLLRGSLYGRLLHRSRGWSPVLLFPHTARCVVPAVSSPLVGALVSAFSRAGSSATLSIVGTATGRATGCSEQSAPWLSARRSLAQLAPSQK